MCFRLLIIFFIINLEYSYGGLDKYQIFSNENTSSEISESKFYIITAEIYSLYQRHDIQVTNDWEKPYFTAYANQETSKIFSINFWGGLARIPDMLEETWAFIVCHELGHILGGTPYLTIDSLSWSSTEGQSDYFAAHSCLPNYFKSKKLNISMDRYLAYEVAFCSNMHLEFNDQLVCLHILRAQRGFVSINRFMQVKDEYTFNKSSEKMKKPGRNSYPALQCRMNTLTDGAACLNSNCPRNSCWY